MSYNILDFIGNTPLVEIRHLSPNPKVKIFAKLEYFNPGGSVKDRVALRIIEEGERTGALTLDKIVIEATSGNTGIGLALVCSVKGYKLTLAMSEAVSQERQKILKARGAEIRLTPGHMGTDGAIEEIYRFSREEPDKYFMVDQYNADANWEAHYYGTAEEIWRQTEGRVTCFVAAMGTTGTLMGVSRRLKEYNPDVKIVGVEPYLGHKIQGLKNMKEAYCPGLYDKRRLDEVVNIDDEDAYEMARTLSREEGLFVGMSSGAAMAIALRKAEEMEEGVIVVLLPDSGERYLSTALFTPQQKFELKLYNSMTRRLEPFVPRIEGSASVYSCGPTADKRMHITEMRRFVFADLLCRYLEFGGLNVKHIMNVTDMDDKTIAAAEHDGVDLKEFTQGCFEKFLEDQEKLKIKPADKYPKVSESIDDMVTLAQKLVNAGFAYERLRSLYFNISKVPNYGHLSGIDINKIKLGATVDLDEYEKDNPRDFTLFRRCTLQELKKGIFTPTEWGNVRPSLHIQCAAIAMRYLGNNFDIHTSNRDLIFPHHENENAIAEALTGKSMANYWVHCEQVLVDGKKEVPAREGINLDDFAAMGLTPAEVRFWLLMTHYRKPLIFSPKQAVGSKSSLERINRCLRSLAEVHGGCHYAEIDQLLYDLKQGFIRAMDDDLNVSEALGVIFTQVKKINTLIADNALNSVNAAKIIKVFKQFNDVLQVFDIGEHQLSEDVLKMMEERERARTAKNWELADKLRAELLARGITVRDEAAS